MVAIRDSALSAAVAGPRYTRYPAIPTLSEDTPHFNDAVTAVIEDTVIVPGRVGADVSAADAAPGVPASRTPTTTAGAATRDANGPTRCRAARGARQPAGRQLICVHAISPLEMNPCASSLIW